MLMNDKIIFDRYYCINSGQTQKIMVHYILQSHHIFLNTRKSIHSCAHSGRSSVTHYKYCVFRVYPCISLSHFEHVAVVFLRSPKWLRFNF